MKKSRAVYLFFFIKTSALVAFLNPPSLSLTHILASGVLVSTKRKGFLPPRTAFTSKTDDDLASELVVGGGPSSKRVLALRERRRSIFSKGSKCRI
jgi:hypothetical protein